MMAGTEPLPVSADDVERRLREVRSRIDAVSGGRQVEVLAVTKGFGTDAVEAAVHSGLPSVGENYAQELLAKAGAGAGGTSVRWHFIGGLQRNKVASLAPHVALWQTVDRLPLLKAIAGHAPGAAVMIQVNLTGDATRSGCGWGDVGELATAGRSLGLDVRGLMGVGPPGPPETARPLFARLARCAQQFGLRELSMGMSGDLEVAVAEGSTMIRVGTALFGPRPRPDDLRR